VSGLQVPKKPRMSTVVVYLSDWAQTDRGGFKFGWGDLDLSDFLQFPRAWIGTIDWAFLSLFSYLKTCLPTDTCSASQPWSKCQCPPCACAEGCYRWVGDTGERRKAVWGGAERRFAHAQQPRAELCRYFWNVWRENCRRSRCWSSPNMVPTVILPW
jgi:hypothetical protein